MPQEGIEQGSELAQRVLKMSMGGWMALTKLLALIDKHNQDSTKDVIKLIVNDVSYAFFVSVVSSGCFLGQV